MKRRTRISRHSFQLLGRLYATLGDLGEWKPVRLRGVCELSRTKVKIAAEDLPVELVLGPNGKRLQLYWESPLEPTEVAPGEARLIILDPDLYAKEISGFMLVAPGGRLVLGRGDRTQQVMLNFPHWVKRCHLLVRHGGDGVVLQNFSLGGASVAPAEDQVRPHRHAVMDRLGACLCGLGAPLGRDQALALLQRVNRLAADEPYRPRDSRGLPGSLLNLPYHLAPVMVADLHARVDNLLTVLSQNRFFDAIERGKAYLLLLGDAVHSEDENRLTQMEESMRLMDIYFTLKVKYPSRVFYLRGNHDAFGEEVSKKGVPQGPLWAKALREQRGSAYLEAMAQFYDGLPYLALSGDFIACHGGPPRTRVSRETLVDLVRYPRLIREILTNRLRRPGNPQGYTGRHIDALRDSLRLMPEAAFIVGHTPLDREDTLWMNAGGIPGHYILYSAGVSEVGIVTRVGGRLVSLRYPTEPLTRRLAAPLADGPGLS
jgi:hypothetical protein